MDWAEGYVADVSYTHGYYRELNPVLQRYALLNRGIAAGPASDHFAYCELGCGLGLSATLHAAAHPDAEFHATDFMPGHIASARSLAADAGTGNVHFYDDSFEQFCQRDLPEFDVIALHGVYSWISAESRRHVVDFIARRLKVGGLVYISYNCQPGWAAAMPMREMMLQLSGAGDTPTLSRIETALERMQALFEARASYTLVNPELKGRFDGIKDHSRSYVAHEFFNRNWTVFYHTDVARDMGDAKLAFAAPVSLLEQIDSIMLTPEQQALLEKAGSPTQRELMFDFIINQQFRRDLFAKGGLPLPARRREDLLKEMRFVLSDDPAKIPPALAVPPGSVTLNQEIFGPLIAALTVGPRSIGDLMADPATAPLGFPVLAQALAMLVGSNHAQPCLDASGESRRSESLERFNRAVLERAIDSHDIGFLVSPLTGGGVFLPRMSQLFLLARKQGAADPVAAVWPRLAERNEALLRDGQTLLTAEDNLARLREVYDDFTTKLPRLQQLGIA